MARKEPSSNAKPELNLEQFLPYRLNSLADRASQALAREYAERHQLNVAQWRVLAWLSYLDELTAKQICQATRMDKARISRAVQSLEDRGLIRRTPSSRDQRVHDLCLTEAGKVLLATLIPEARQWESDLVATLSVGEYRDLLNLMDKLERQLDRLEQADGPRPQDRSDDRIEMSESDNPEE
ncbi:MarR family winged helix-turn-helix transcriptional regulator [Halomonas binhaiensis]|uniref:Winged helix-turn-helix transcriptional regulator n=1 Tax=Halomonas binhaiensis TaxID=2562282 RepID=A0A5C1NDL2_9GAMM|nr:MarR family winged helix-turn-helix transcriptional regulator [Halomonas binhaiensis]QEM80137.1 winged helix-turn-helix transcriptional regulator [Halomonas binhaiensis]